MKTLIAILFIFVAICSYGQVAKISINDQEVVIEDGSFLFKEPGDTVYLQYYDKWTVISSGDQIGVIKTIALPQDCSGAKTYHPETKEYRFVEDYSVGLFAVGDTIKITKSKKSDPDDAFGWRVYYGTMHPSHFGDIIIEYAVIKKKFR